MTHYEQSYTFVRPVRFRAAKRHYNPCDSWSRDLLAGFSLCSATGEILQFVRC